MYKKFGFTALILIVAAVSFQLISMAKTNEPQGNETPVALHLFPQNQQLKEGESASWYLTVAGAEPIQYQWKCNGQNISGANSNTLKIASVKNANQGIYTCFIRNKFGGVETDPVQLNVIGDSGITTSQRIDVEKIPGNSTAKNLDSSEQ